ncbi:MAG TPA: hypothetical protein VK253_07875 [Candidatus Binatia bacterium]|nr:hypothetical protein [Candidatus Binatia bacterium]
MNLKKSIDKCIRGWLPKEPVFPARTSATHTRPKISIFVQNAIIGLILIAGLYCALFLINYSWIKIVLLGSILVGGILWLVTRGKLRMTLKYFVLSLMIFGIAFGSFERYVLWNAGFPSTLMPSETAVTISYPRILNVSLTEIIQSAKNTVAFNVFRLEHPGEARFESILLDSTFPGGEIEVTFYNEAANMGFGFISSAGYHYHASNLPWIGQPLSSIYSQVQPPEEALEQIDNLGLHWFFDRASEIYENKTGANSNVSSLEISTQWQQYGHYQGMILQMIAWQRNGDSIQNTFIAAFKPDGNSLYLNIPK